MTTTPTAVNVACPPWCERTTEVHEAEVAKGERYLIHQSAGSPAAHDWILTMMQDPEGTPTPERPGYAPVSLMDGDDVVHPDDAERLAHAILKMVAIARGQQGVTR